MLPVDLLSLGPTLKHQEQIYLGPSLLAPLLPADKVYLAGRLRHLRQEGPYLAYKMGSSQHLEALPHSEGRGAFSVFLDNLRLRSSNSSNNRLLKWECTTPTVIQAKIRMHLLSRPITLHQTLPLRTQRTTSRNSRRKSTTAKTCHPPTRM